MPTYPVINKETMEQKEIVMSVPDWEQWKESNSDWIRDWSQGCAGFAETGEWKDKLMKQHPSWKEILKKSGAKL